MRRQVVTAVAAGVGNHERWLVVAMEVGQLLLLTNYTTKLIARGPSGWL